MNTFSYLSNKKKPASIKKEAFQNKVKKIMNALRITPVKVLDTNSVKVYFSSLNFLRSMELMPMIIALQLEV